MATLVLDPSQNRLAKPIQLTINGVCEPEEQTDAFKKEIMKIIQNSLVSYRRNSQDRDNVRSAIQEFLINHFKKRPVVDVHFIEV